MVKKLTFLILIFHIGIICFGQKTLEKERFYLFVSPLSLIDIVDYPSLRIGGDLNLTNHLAIGIEAGPYFYGSRGYSIKPYFKVYYNSHNYIALEYQYKNQTIDLAGDFRTDSETTYFRKYTMHNYSNTFNIKIGGITKCNETFITRLIGKNQITDGYVGIGIRFYDSEALNITQEELDQFVEVEDIIGIFFEAQDNLIGSAIYFNITLGFKIGLGVK